MKRIAIFCDGTWNTPDEIKEGRTCQTNVVKMADALCEQSLDKTRQLLYYDVGVGSEGSKLKKVFDGATGTGISANILQASWFLSQNYEPGDELFFFGFSRGAFTVRSLAGLIRNSGILHPKYKDRLPQAYNLYKSRNPRFHPKSEESTLFRRTYAVEDVTKIRFIGVWDTVGSLGNPLFLKGIVSERNEFHDTGISSHIENAYHALAIDERRKNFQAALWQQKPSDARNVLEQMWFAGVHSDVGGGYPESALSDISLQWMLEKAIACGLHFRPIPVNPDPLGLKHESMTPLYRLAGILHRPIGEPQPDGILTHEKIHPSVLIRYEHDRKYRPPNLVKYLERK